MSDQEFTHKGLMIRIEQDLCPGGSRQWDNFGTLLCFHRIYEIGDKQDEYFPISDSDRFEGKKVFRSFLELDAMVRRDHPGAVVLPVFLLDHSGLRVSVGDSVFRACDPQGWDWGLVGFIYASGEKIREEYGVKRITRAIREKARDLLVSEVETLDQELRGDVWCYDIKNPYAGESMDSCGGFYGFDFCKEEAISAADTIVSELAMEVAAVV